MATYKLAKRAKSLRCYSDKIRNNMLKKRINDKFDFRGLKFNKQFKFGKDSENILINLFLTVIALAFFIAIKASINDAIQFLKNGFNLIISLLYIIFVFAIASFLIFPLKFFKI